MCDKALPLMTERFGHDTIVSLATLDGNMLFNIKI